MDKSLTGCLHRTQPQLANGDQPGAPAPQNPTTAAPAPTGRLSGSPIFNRPPAAPETQTLPQPGADAHHARLEKIASKEVPYNAKKLGANVMLNNRVSTLQWDGATPYVERVVCRHFAQEFVEAAGRKRKLMETFEWPRAIAGRFESRLSDLNTEFEKAEALAKPDSKHVLREDHLGHYLVALAESLPKPNAEGQSEANCLLSTTRHAMALHMARKSRDGAEYFSVKLYDPNSTASYKRVEASSVESLRGLALQDMLVAPRFGSSYSDTAGRPSILIAVCTDPRLRPNMDRSITSTSIDAMHMAMSAGSLEDVRQVLSNLGSIEVGTDDFKGMLFKVLQANSRYQHAPGLFMALLNGHVETMQVFAQRVLSSSALSLAQKIDLIAAKAEDDAPALAVAIQYADANAIEAYVEVVLNTSVFTDTQKVELIAAKDSHGSPALFVALQEGKAPAVAAYARAVLSSSALTDDQKVELLCARHPDGTPGLRSALEQESGSASETLDLLDATDAFKRAVRMSSLSREHKAQVLNV